MKPTVPILCSAALVAMCGAVAGHWWSVRQFVSAIHASTPVAREVNPISNPPPPALAAPQLPPLAQSPRQMPAMDPAQKEFFEALIRKMQAVESRNRDLEDKLGETNRDIWNLQFQVDTHSSQFRPMPVNEDRLDTTLDGDGGAGVLPPRAEEVGLPTHE